MHILPRKEQEHLILSYERDYGKLVMQYNGGIKKDVFNYYANDLVNQIKKSATPKYLEEDLIECLEGMAASIQKFFVH